MRVIQYPQSDELQFYGPMQYTIADFGKIPYGAESVSPLKFANPPDACTPLKHPELSDLHKVEDYLRSPPIFLIERGNCKFVEKVLNVQKAGGKMALIADNMEETLQYMADNGEGDVIQIPGIFITSSEGAQLHRAIQIQQEQPVFEEILISVDFLLNSPPMAENSQVMFVLDIPNPLNYQLVINFFHSFFNFEEKIEFTPVYYVFPILQQNEHTKNSCYKNQNYCTIDQDGNDFPGTGEELVEEYLYQACIYDGYGLRTWSNYIKLQHESCYQIANFNHCRKIINAQLEIEEEILEECLSFDSNGHNYALDHSVLYTGIAIDDVTDFPAILINDLPYRGSKHGYDVLEAVCASNDYRSQECQKLINKFSKQFDEFPVQMYEDFLDNQDLRNNRNGGL